MNEDRKKSSSGASGKFGKPSKSHSSGEKENIKKPSSLYESLNPLFLELNNNDDVKSKHSSEESVD